MEPRYHVFQAGGLHEVRRGSAFEMPRAKARRDVQSGMRRHDEAEQAWGAAPCEALPWSAGSGGGSEDITASTGGVGARATGRWGGASEASGAGVLTFNSKSFIYGIWTQ